MAKTIYESLTEISKLQTSIMNFVDFWVRSEKVPVPRKEIIIKMKSEGVEEASVKDALRALLKKGYIREAVTISNKTYYVQLRRV